MRDLDETLNLGSLLYFRISSIMEINTVRMMTEKASQCWLTLSYLLINLIRVEYDDIE